MDRFPKIGIPAQIATQRMCRRIGPHESPGENHCAGFYAGAKGKETDHL